MTPTQRTLKLLKEQGYHVRIVERWNPFARKRVDLFGGDILAIKRGEPPLLVQCTSATNLASRWNKSIKSEEVKAWLLTLHTRFEVWGWGKKGKRGERKVWDVTVREVNLCNLEV